MSFLVLHMDKFKKEAVRGIQSHNNRERKSHSNPDIAYERSAENYELAESATADYAAAVQNRIDDLLLVKAVRKDAVHMCGLIVSSDREFFWRCGPEETRRFFVESAAFLSAFVGKENVVSAMVHLDEKTPHMHFLHVPVTQDGKLNANKIYTRESLKILQTEFHRHLQSKGFDVQRGVEQVPGAKEKHLDTRAFKQQQEALNGLHAESATLAREALFLVGAMAQQKEREAALQAKLQEYEEQAWEAEQRLQETVELPEANMLNFKSVLQKARDVIALQKQALSSKHIADEKNKRLEEEMAQLRQRVQALERERSQRKQMHDATVNALKKQVAGLQESQAEIQQFLSQPEVAPLHKQFLQEQQRQAEQAELARHMREEKEYQARKFLQEQMAQQQKQQGEQEKQQKTQQPGQPQPQQDSPTPVPYRGMRMGR